MTHTPGPWIAGHMTNGSHECNCRYILADGYFGSVAVISERKTDESGCNDSPPEDEAVANAHLIAAAPDLFDALSAIVASVSTGPSGDVCQTSDFEAAKAALAKARGTCQE